MHSKTNGKEIDKKNIGIQLIVIDGIIMLKACNCSYGFQANANETKIDGIHRIYLAGIGNEVSISISMAGVY